MNFQKNEDAFFQKIQTSAQNEKESSKKDSGISNQTRDKVEAAKTYIENKYSRMKKEEAENKLNWNLLNEKMENMNLDDQEKEKIKREILHKEAEQMRMKRKKLCPEDFEPINIIGRGAFGEVRLCKWKESGEIVVIKKMKKSEMVFKNQVAHIRAERDILATANIPWIVELKCSFQDDIYLYLVMEYLPGGDLMTLLMKKDILSEDESKFYIAETILAIDSVHKLNYIHRDLKPDNILIDRIGHIKLTDFGLCKHTEIRPKKIDIGKKNENDKPGLQLEIGKKPGFRRNRQMAYSTVGTPDYIAPEVFQQNGYTETVDWWSLGTILYEMLVGYPPFFSEDPSQTCNKILHWRKHFSIPSEANLSPASIDLLRRLITDANERLGINGVEEIKAHPFFAGIDWKKLREKKAPMIPELKNETDTSNFDKFDEEEPWIPDYSKAKKTRKDVNFIGYTYNRNVESQKSSLVAALIDLETNKQSNLRKPVQMQTSTDESEKDNNYEQVIKPEVKNTDKNFELAQESIMKSITSSGNYDISNNFKSGFQGKMSNETLNKKAVSPVNPQNNFVGIKTNNLMMASGSGGSSSSSNKNQGAAALNTQNFSTKVSNLEYNSNMLKKNIDMNAFNVSQTSHLKTNLNQKNVKGNEIDNNKGIPSGYSNKLPQKKLLTKDK